MASTPFNKGKQTPAKTTVSWDCQHTCVSLTDSAPCECPLDANFALSPAQPNHDFHHGKSRENYWNNEQKPRHKVIQQ
jgi:hypothetical protein